MVLNFVVKSICAKGGTFLVLAWGMWHRIKRNCRNASVAKAQIIAMRSMRMHTVFWSVARGSVTRVTGSTGLGRRKATLYSPLVLTSSSSSNMY